MPLQPLHHLDDSFVWGSWYITETLEALQQYTALSPDETTYWHTIQHPTPQRCFLASRVLIKALSSQWGLTHSHTDKNALGAVYLPSYPSIYVSLSHTAEITTAIIHRNKPVGIDIEKERPQLLRLRHKFLSPTELDFCGENLTLLTLCWSGKEALYKLYGQKKLTFKTDMAILPFVYQQAGSFEIALRQASSEQIYKAHYQSLDNHWVVYMVAT